MRVYSDLPDLTMAEANRYRLKPRQVLDIAKLDDRAPKTRTWFNNIVHRGGHIPSEPHTVGKITTRTFSLVSCIMARAMHEELHRERSPATAEVIARAVADLLPLALQYPTLDDFRMEESEGTPWRVLLIDIPFGGKPVRTEVVMPEDITAENFLARDWWGCSAIYPHQLLLRCIESYADLWAAARQREFSERVRAANSQKEVCAE